MKSSIMKYTAKVVSMLKCWIPSLARSRLVVLVGISGLFLGYLLASFLVCVETWVDSSTGIIEDRVKLFPFVLKCRRKTPFDAYYGRYLMRHSTANWIFVDERPLNPLIYFESITKGEYLTQAEAQIIQADLVHSFSFAQRERVANEFFDRLAKGGVFSCYNYSDEILLHGVCEPNSRVGSSAAQDSSK
jgi:hypothetical protein